MAVPTVVKHEKFSGVYWVKEEGMEERLATRNLTPGVRVYGEPLVKAGGVEYRVWNPYRSKLAAAILKKVKEVPISKGSRVLYLGAASGTTASHVSDIVWKEGRVYCVEFAPRVARELLTLCEKRSNMIPIVADARMPWLYRTVVEEVDAIYCDVAQPEQAGLLADNAEMFLKKGGWIMLAIKARSVDVTKEPSEIYRREINTLKSRGFDVMHVVHLEPFDKDHAMVVARFKP